MSSVALNGNLRDFGISEVFQLIGQQRKTGILRVRDNANEVEAHFDEGRIVAAAPAGAGGAALCEMLVRCGALAENKLRKIQSARDLGESVSAVLVREGGLAESVVREVEDLLTRESLFDLLRWADGSFHFVAQAVPHDRNPESLLGAEQVLMDGLRMVDEWSAFASEAPSPQLIYRRRGSLEEFRASKTAHSQPNPGEVERLFLLIDGRSNVRRVTDLSRLGTFLGTRILVDLARSGWIEPVNGRRHSAAPIARRRVPARTVLANVIPVLLLAALALLATPKGSVRTSPLLGSQNSAVSWSLGRDSLQEVQIRFAGLRMRNLTEAFRLVEGDWPTHIQPLQLWAAKVGALTPLEHGPYYFRAQEEGPVLLAPELYPTP